MATFSVSKETNLSDLELETLFDLNDHNGHISSTFQVGSISPTTSTRHNPETSTNKVTFATPAESGGRHSPNCLLMDDRIGGSRIFPLNLVRNQSKQKLSVVIDRYMFDPDAAPVTRHEVEKYRKSDSPKFLKEYIEEPGKVKIPSARKASKRRISTRKDEPSQKMLHLPSIQVSTKRNQIESQKKSLMTVLHHERSSRSIKHDNRSIGAIAVSSRKHSSTPDYSHVRSQQRLGSHSVIGTENHTIDYRLQRVNEESDYKRFSYKNGQRSPEFRAVDSMSPLSYKKMVTNSPRLPGNKAQIVSEKIKRNVRVLQKEALKERNHVLRNSTNSRKSDGGEKEEVESLRQSADGSNSGGEQSKLSALGKYFERGGLAPFLKLPEHDIRTLRIAHGNEYKAQLNGWKTTMGDKMILMNQLDKQYFDPVLNNKKKVVKKDQQGSFLKFLRPGISPTKS